MNINDEKSKQIRSAIQHQLSIHLDEKEALWQATAIFNLVVAQMKADFAAALRRARLQRLQELDVDPVETLVPPVPRQHVRLLLGNLMISST